MAASMYKIHAISPAGGSDKHGKHSSVAARFLGSGTAGIAELVLFHPVDTVAKRLMNFEVSEL